MRALKLIFAAAVFPSALLVCAQAAKGFYGVFSNIHATGWFCGGFAAYAAVHFAFGGLGRIYVFAHELAHAAAGVATGCKVRSFSVGAREGNVVMEGSNAFTALAPYCAPVYAVLCALVYAAASLKWDLTAYSGWFFCATGFFLSFHLLNTFEILWSTRQSDLRQAGGVFFSVSVILAANSALLLASFKLLYPRLINVHSACFNVADGTRVFWQWTAVQVALAWVSAQPGMTAPILGARSVEQLNENLGFLGWRLSPDEKARLNAASDPGRPYPHDYLDYIAAEYGRGDN